MVIQMRFLNKRKVSGCSRQAVRMMCVPIYNVYKEWLENRPLSLYDAVAG